MKEIGKITKRGETKHITFHTKSGIEDFFKFASRCKKGNRAVSIHYKPGGKRKKR